MGNIVARSVKSRIPPLATRLRSSACLGVTKNLGLNVLQFIRSNDDRRIIEITILISSPA